MLTQHPDPTVDHVLKTWAPRMIVQGIDYNDLMTTGERIRTWDDWCREWCMTAAGHEEFARKAEAGGNRESATEAYLMASMAYHFGCNNSPQNLDEYIPAAKKRVECYAKAAPYLHPPAARQEVPFENFRMAAYLRVPPGIKKPPVVVIISGLESTKEEARTKRLTDSKLFKWRYYEITHSQNRGCARHLCQSWSQWRLRAAASR